MNKQKAHAHQHHHHHQHHQHHHHPHDHGQVPQVDIARLPDHMLKEWETESEVKFLSSFIQFLWSYISDWCLALWMKIMITTRWAIENYPLDKISFWKSLWFWILWNWKLVNRVKYIRGSSPQPLSLLVKYHLIMLRASKSYDEDGDIYEAEEKVEKKHQKN